MKQRVKLAQALVHDPRLLLLDEPTNGLDPAGRDDMLDLVHRVGSEFGISIIMSSHLLGEIQRVCDAIVVIDAGRLVRAGPVSGYTADTGVLAVELESGNDALAGRLAAAGIDTHADGRTLLIDLRDGDPYDLVRDTAAELGVGLVRMERRRQSLEEIFRDADADPEEVASAAGV
jgi:ABC-2 type transport system ATP-binding protein